MRVSIGQAGQAPAYRMASIRGILSITIVGILFITTFVFQDVIESERRYIFENTPSSKKLELQHGANKRAFRMDMISNQPLTEVSCPLSRILHYSFIIFGLLTIY